MQADGIIADGWQRRYRELLQYNDLQPFRYASRAVETPLAQYSEGQANINISSAFWLFGMQVFAYGRRGDQENQFATAAFPSVDVRIRINGEYPWTSWIDSQSLPGLLFDQWGPGFVLERDADVLVEWRRPYPIAAEDILEQVHQFVLYGVSLEQLGAVRIDDNWRNLSREDWQEVAELQPVMYSNDADAPIAAGTANQWTEVPIRITARPFVLERVHVYQMDTAGEDDTGIPVQPGPWLSAITLGSGAVLSNVDVPGIASQSWGGIPGFQPEWKYRIPRLIRANETIRVMVGGNPWPFTGEYADAELVPRVTLKGYSIVEDRRRQK